MKGIRGCQKSAKIHSFIQECEDLNKRLREEIRDINIKPNKEAVFKTTTNTIKDFPCVIRILKGMGGFEKEIAYVTGKNEAY